MPKKQTEPGTTVLQISIRAHLVIIVLGLIASGVAALVIFASEDAAPVPLLQRPPVAMLSMFMTIVAACVAAYGAIYAVEYARWNVDAKTTELRADKLRRTFELLRYLDQDNRADGRLLIREKFSGPAKLDSKNLDAINQAFANDRELWKCVHKTLGALDDVALAVKFGYADEALLFGSIGLVVCDMLTWFHHWIIEQQAEQDPEMFEHFVELGQAWKQRQSLSGGALTKIDTALLEQTKNAPDVSR